MGNTRRMFEIIIKKTITERLSQNLIPVWWYDKSFWCYELMME